MPHDVVGLFPRLEPLRSREDYEKLKTAAAADGHTVIVPTHLAWRRGEIVGYGSLGALPLLNLWLDRSRVTGRDSLALMNLAECLMIGHGAKGVIVPCSEDSPFYPHLESLGFQRLGRTTLNVKGF